MNNNTIKPPPFDSESGFNEDTERHDRISVLIVDDQNLVRERLKILIEPEQDLEVVGTANNGARAIAQIESLQPDIALVDLEMPEMDGVEATKIICDRFPECKVLILTSHDGNEYLNEALRAGAKGYLLKSTPVQELIAAIRSVYKGYSHLGPGLFEKFLLTEPKSNSNERQTCVASNSTVSTTKENKLFREKSLERLSSPERLDQLMRIVSPKSWLPLVTLGAVVGVAVVWSVYGSIPVTVEGKGVLIYPSKVVSLQSKSAGQIVSLKIKDGDIVKKGEIIATVDQIDLRKQLQLQRSKLVELQAQDREARSLLKQRKDLDLKTIQQQRQTLQQSLQALQSLTPILREKGLVSIQRDRINIERRLQTLRGLIPTLKERLENRQRLFKEGAINDDIVLQSRQEYIDSLAKIDEAQSQLKQLDVKEADALKDYLSNSNEIKNVKAQLQELESKQADRTQQDLEISTTRKKEIQETERKIDELQEQINNNTQIVTQHSGRILEITANPGQVVEAGTRIASIDLNTSGKLVSITYFAIEDGKKIQPNMPIQITPQTVKRERFGGIEGIVTQISAFPITKESAAKVVGNPEVVEGLVSDKKQGVMQVFSTLQSNPQTFSGYQWSSSFGPKLKISSGTTATVRVKVEDRAPITFIMPILRSLSGIY